MKTGMSYIRRRANSPDRRHPRQREHRRRWRQRYPRDRCSSRGCKRQALMRGTDTHGADTHGGVHTRRDWATHGEHAQNGVESNFEKFTCLSGRCCEAAHGSHAVPSDGAVAMWVCCYNVGAHVSTKHARGCPAKRQATCSDLTQTFQVLHGGSAPRHLRSSGHRFLTLKLCRWTLGCER